MKKVLFLASIFFVVVSGVQAVSFTPINDKAFVAKEESAAETVAPETDDKKTNITQQGESITCADKKFTVRVVSINVDASGKVGAGALNNTQKQNTRIEKKCLKGTIVNGWVQKEGLKEVSPEDASANAVGVKIAVPKPEGWLDAFSKRAFQALLGGLNDKKKEEDAYIYASAVCPLTKEAVVFYVETASDKKQLTFKHQCGKGTQVSNEEQIRYIYGQGDYPYNYDTNANNPYDNSQSGATQDGLGQSAEDALSGYGGDDSPTGASSGYGVSNNDYPYTGTQDDWLNQAGQEEQGITDGEDYGWSGDYGWDDDGYDNGSTYDYDDDYGEKATADGLSSPFAEDDEVSAGAPLQPAPFADATDAEGNFTYTVVDGDNGGTLIGDWIDSYKDPNTGEFNFDALEFEYMYMGDELNKYPGWESNFTEGTTFEQLQWYYPSLTEDDYSLMQCITTGAGCPDNYTSWVFDATVPLEEPAQEMGWWDWTKYYVLFGWYFDPHTQYDM